jgi:hypothetical protein
MEANRSSRFAGTVLAPTLQVDSVRRWITSREMLARWAFLTVAATIFFVQLPVLTFYFAGDDFVPLGDIASHSPWMYISDLFLLRDPTPNWRFLTGLVYLGLYHGFGANAFVFLFMSLLVHIATAALIYRFVLRRSGLIWAAALAAALFGVSAAHVPTVAYAMAFTHVFGAFLIMLSLIAIDEAFDHEHSGWWRAASVFFFAAAVAANEPVAVLAPLLALVAFCRSWELREDRRRELPAAVLMSVAYIAISQAAISSLAACNCTVASELTGPGNHIFGNIWIYLGRLLYPIGLERPGQISTAHIVAGSMVLAGMALALIRGPGPARIAVAFLALSLAPYLPVNWFLAPRYVYLAAVPFSILAAFLAIDLVRQLQRLSPLLPAVVGMAALGAVGLSAWQTWEQNHFLDAESAHWRSLVVGLHDRYPNLPAGSRVYVRGGPLSDPLWQQQVMPAIGEVLWKDVGLYNAPDGARGLCAAPDGQTLVLDFNDGTLTPVQEVRVVPAGSGSRAVGETALVPALVVRCPNEESS